MKKILTTVIASVASVVLAEVATVSDVEVRQLWPWSGDIDIGFTVEGGNTAVKLTAQYDGVEPFVIPEGQLSGDFFDAAPGRRHVRWNLKRAGLDDKTLFNLKITAQADTTDRTYLILNLYDGSYRYAAKEPEIEKGWLADPANYQTNIVFRRIPKGTKILGLPEDLREKVGFTAAYSKQHGATLTSDYYLSVYPITAAQQTYASARAQGLFKNVSNDSELRLQKRYAEIRGSHVTQDIDWPSTQYKVAEGSLIADYRTIVANTFPSDWIVDLPTVVQWEYAARADTPDGQLYSVGGVASESMEQITNHINKIALWVNNKSGKESEDKKIGTKLPNGWGLYDMIGLCHEWNLDWYLSNKDYYSGVNPVGPESQRQGNGRARRSVAISEISSLQPCTTAYMTHTDPETTSTFGYRLCINLESLFRKR